MSHAPSFLPSNFICKIIQVQKEKKTMNYSNSRNRKRMQEKVWNERSWFWVSRVRNMLANMNCRGHYIWIVLRWNTWALNISCEKKFLTLCIAATEQKFRSSILIAMPWEMRGKSARRKREKKVFNLQTKCWGCRLSKHFRFGFSFFFSGRI